MSDEDMLPLSDFSAFKITTTLHTFSKTSPDGLSAMILLLTWKGSPQRSRCDEEHGDGQGCETGAGQAAGSRLLVSFIMGLNISWKMGRECWKLLWGGNQMVHCRCACEISCKRKGFQIGYQC